MKPWSRSTKLTDSIPAPPLKKIKKLKKTSDFQGVFQAGRDGRGDGGRGKRADLFIFIQIVYVFFIKASKLILDDVEDFGVGRFSKSTMGFYPSLE